MVRCMIDAIKEIQMKSYWSSKVGDNVYVFLGGGRIREGFIVVFNAFLQLTLLLVLFY